MISASQVGQPRAVLEQGHEIGAQGRDHPAQPRARQPRQRLGKCLALAGRLAGLLLARPQQQLLELVDQQRHAQAPARFGARQGGGNRRRRLDGIGQQAGRQLGRLRRELRHGRCQRLGQRCDRRAHAAARHDHGAAPAVVGARHLLEIAEQAGARQRGFADAAAAMDQQEAAAVEILSPQHLQGFLARLAAAPEDLAMADVEHFEAAERRAFPGVVGIGPAGLDVEVEGAQQVLDLPYHQDLGAEPAQLLLLGARVGAVGFRHGDDDALAAGDDGSQPFVADQQAELVLDIAHFARRHFEIDRAGGEQPGVGVVGVAAGKPLGAVQRVCRQHRELPAVAGVDLLREIDAERAGVARWKDAGDALAHERVVAGRDRRQWCQAAPGEDPRLAQAERRDPFDGDRP